MINDNDENMNLPKLVLASGSPRRAEILNAVGWEFEKIVADIDEEERVGEAGTDYVVRLAREKAGAVAKLKPKGLVLGADTTVICEGNILAKPVDRQDAFRMIAELSGKTHSVLTGIALVKDGQIESGVEETFVTFSRMNREEIEFLVENGAPLDKAGGYAVQAQAALFIERIEGDYWNVVGLPIQFVYRLAQRFE